MTGSRIGKLVLRFQYTVMIERLYERLTVSLKFRDFHVIP